MEKQAVQNLIQKSKADFTEVRIQDKAYTIISYKGKDLEHIQSLRDIGGLVRTLVAGAWAVSTFNNLNDLEKEIEKATKNARTIAHNVPEDKKVSLKEVPPVIDEVKTILDKDFRIVPLQEKKELVEKYNDIILRNKHIASTTTHYRDEFSHIYYCNSEGTYIHEERPDARIRFVATAKNAQNIQRALGGVATSRGFRPLETLEQEAHETAQRAAMLLHAQPPKGGEYTVILDPILAGTFIHEAFGHFSEADHISENKKLKDVMQLGRSIAVPALNVIDDGSREGLRGTHKYDDEGVKTKKNYLIHNGKLVGRLHSRQTAAKMNEAVTGNARALSYHYEPIVRMTNTYIDRGEASFEDLLKSTKRGIYAKSFFGGNTAFELFTFSSEYAFMIEDGKITTPLCDVVLSGNLFKTLQNIELIANDLGWEENGGCGKMGQVGLPTPTGSPHIKINNVIVGG